MCGLFFCIHFFSMKYLPDFQVKDHGIYSPRKITSEDAADGV